MKYSTLILGNGLTINILNHIQRNVPELNGKLDLAKFINDFFTAENHRRVVKNYYRILKSCFIEEHFYNAKKFIYAYLEDIKNIGFERWISKRMFNIAFDSEVSMYAMSLCYGLTNFWYSNIYELINKNSESTYIINQYKMKIHDICEGEIYTVNFDTLLDQMMNIKHLHGKFVIPFVDFYYDLHLFDYKIYGKEKYEYRYLYGATAIEKLDRLKRI